MQSATESIQNPQVFQPETLTEPATENTGFFHGMRCFFYHYDPLEGTCLNWPGSSAVVTGATGAGALAGHLLFSKLPETLTEGASLFDRVIQKLEEPAQSQPVVYGAIAGATIAVSGIYMLGSSLKPMTQEGIRAVRDQLVNQLQRDTVNISNYREQVYRCKQQLAKLKPFLPAEQAQNRSKAETLHDQQMQRYLQENSYILGQLKEQLDGFFTKYSDPQRLPTYDEATTAQSPEKLYHAGRKTENFINNGDYSWRAKKNLIAALKPVLAAKDLKAVRQKLAELPLKPVLYIPKGPYETKYDQINSERATAILCSDLIEAEIKQIIERFPVLKPGPKGQIPIPDMSSFAAHLPE